MARVSTTVALLLLACNGDPATGAWEVVPPPDGGPDFANTLIRGRPPGSVYAGNTVAAILEADAAGYRHVEVDVRVSADGRLIPCRHGELSVFTSCEGPVSGAAARDLESCTVTSGEPTPMRPLDAALEGASFDGLYLDLKSTETTPLSSPEEIRDAVAALLEHAADPSAVVAMSYREDVAAMLLDAGIRTGLKGYPSDTAGVSELVEAAADVGAEMICVHLSLLDDAVYERAAERGIWLLPWAHATEIRTDALCRLVAEGGRGLINGDPEAVWEHVSGTCRK